MAYTQKDSGFLGTGILADSTLTPSKEEEEIDKEKAKLLGMPDYDASKDTDYQTAKEDVLKGIDYQYNPYAQKTSAQYKARGFNAGVISPSLQNQAFRPLIDARLNAASQAIAKLGLDYQNLDLAKRADIRSNISLLDQLENSRTNRMENSSGGGTLFLCTELRHRGLMTEYESSIMTYGLLKAMVTRSLFFVWYFSHGKSIIKKLNGLDIDWVKIKEESVTKVIPLIEKGNIVEATKIYTSVVYALAHLVGIKVFYGLEKERIWTIPLLPFLLFIPDTFRWMIGIVKKHLKIGVQKCIN